MIETATKPQGSIFPVDPGADGAGRPEVERRPLNGREFSGGDQRLVHRGEVIRGYAEVMPQNIPAAMVSQIEVGILS